MTTKFEFWDAKADCITKGDCLRDINPVLKKRCIDENGFTHYVFSKAMFHNPKFIIPDDDYELFQKFLDGGSREYPSDGHLPADIAATEAKIILDKIVQIAGNPKDEFCEGARRELKKNGKLGMIRGTIKLYLKNYTTRDWRRKRFTDDIDFWVFNKILLEHVLKRTGWKKNKKTREYEKVIKWLDLRKSREEATLLIASNDTDQILDFGGGSFLEGSTLKDILKKKLRRGHDVDLSDIINVAIVNNIDDNYINKKWPTAWEAIEESANTRSTRITSNMISLCRHSFGIADYIERVASAIAKFQNTVLDDYKYSDKKIVNLCKFSSHHLKWYFSLEPKTTRSRIFNNLTKQKSRKRIYAENLRNFASDVLEILNSKFTNAKIIFEIEN